MADEERDWVALALEASAGVAATFAPVAAGTPAGGALVAASGLAKLAAKLVRTVGVKRAADLVQELVDRKGEGLISDDDLAMDEAAVMADIASWYASDIGEHPPDDPEADDG